MGVAGGDKAADLQSLLPKSFRGALLLAILAYNLPDASHIWHREIIHLDVLATSPKTATENKQNSHARYTLTYSLFVYAVIIMDQH